MRDILTLKTQQESLINLLIKLITLMPSNLILALQSQTDDIPRNSKGLKRGVILLAALPSAAGFRIRSQEFRLVVHLVFWLTYSVSFLLVRSGYSDHSEVSCSSYNIQYFRLPQL